jgi:hypothetical protein
MAVRIVGALTTSPSKISASRLPMLAPVISANRFEEHDHQQAAGQEGDQKRPRYGVQQMAFLVVLHDRRERPLLHSMYQRLEHGLLQGGAGQRREDPCECQPVVDKVHRQIRSAEIADRAESVSESVHLRLPLGGSIAHLHQ